MATMDDRWIALKQSDGDGQTVYVRVDAITSIAPAGMGSRLTVQGSPLRVEETPQQVIQKMRSPKGLLGG
jgi:hypothetical protein